MIIRLFSKFNILILVLLILSQRGIASASVKEVLSNKIIVRAHVVTVEGSDRYNTSTQRIDHIYCGIVPAGVAEFLDSSAAEQSIGVSVWPALKLGQEGLWLLHPLRDRQLLGRRGYNTLGAQWPARPNVEPRYEQALMLAQAMEKVWHAPTEDERLDLLRSFALSEVPEVSIGAIEILAEGAPDRLEQFVHNLDWSSVSASSQGTLDETMVKLNRQEWIASEKRKELIDKWRTLPTKEDDALIILSRLETAIQRKQIDPITFWQILRSAIENEKISRSVRGRAISVARWIVNDPGVNDEAFNVLIKVIDSSSTDEHKLIAAKTLQTLKKVKPEQLGFLIVFREQFAPFINEKKTTKGRIATTLAETVRTLEKEERGDK